MGPSHQYWDDKLQSTQARLLVFLWNITGAKGVAPLKTGQPGTVGFDTISQALIDAELQSASEVAAAAFDATAMGTDAFGGVIYVGGQVKELLGMYYRAWEAGALLYTGAVKAVSALTASTASTQATKTTAGNLAFRTISSALAEGTADSLDAATSGIIEVGFWVIPK